MKQKVSLKNNVMPDSAQKLGKLFRLFKKPGEPSFTVSELELAQEIQANLLPKSFPLSQKMEIGALYKASKYIGGDFYDVIQIDDRKIAFAIGDIAGKSLHAALFMAQCLTLLKVFIKMDLNILKIIEKTNQMLFELVKTDMFATVFIGIYDTHYHQLSYVNAGHNPPLLLRTSVEIPAKDYHPMTMLTAEGIALNCIANMVLEEKRIQLYEGDILLLYTDGLLDATNEFEKEFGEAKLKGLITELRDLPAQQITQKILEHIEGYSKASKTTNDDMAALVIKFKEEK